MIEVQGLTRYYGSFAAVRDASFKIADREIVGFLGLNGAGKSTLLRVLAGLQMPSSGTVPARLRRRPIHMSGSVMLSGSSCVSKSMTVSAIRNQVSTSAAPVYQ